MKPARDAGAHALLFFLCFFALFSSGRIASADAGHQLQASTLLALTGTLGDQGRPGGPANAAWVRAPNGRLYQPHDIGNVVMMLPAAWAGARLSSAPPAEDIRNPPAVSRVVVSLTCAALSALGCWWLFRLLALYENVATAFLLAVTFPLTTIFIAYARAAWDVLGGCVFMCGALYYSARLLRGVAPGRSVVLLAATVAGACSFRFSLGPFIVPAAAAAAFVARRDIRPFQLGAAAMVFVALMLPSFVYNFVRTGSPLLPATATAQYLEGNNALSGNMLDGIYGLWLSPNRGLFLFSPVLFFALVIPVVWSRLARDQQRVLVCYGIGAIAYVLLISKMANWGAFGWGPRYLVPVLPVIFLAASIGLVHAWRLAKPFAVVVVALSAFLTLPPAFVNWHLATTTFPGATDADAPYPYQQIAGWRALGWGLQGKPMPVSSESAHDPLRATTGTFPDLLLVRLARHSRTGFIAASLSVLASAVIALSCARRLLLLTDGGSSVGHERVSFHQ